MAQLRLKCVFSPKNLEVNCLNFNDVSIAIKKATYNYESDSVRMVQPLSECKFG